MVKSFNLKKYELYGLFVNWYVSSNCEIINSYVAISGENFIIAKFNLFEPKNLTTKKYINKNLSFELEPYESFGLYAKSELSLSIFANLSNLENRILINPLCKELNINWELEHEYPVMVEPNLFKKDVIYTSCSDYLNVIKK